MSRSLSEHEAMPGDLLVWTSQRGLMKTKTSCNIDVVSSSLPHGSAVTVLTVVQNLNYPKLIIHTFIS